MMSNLFIFFFFSSPLLGSPDLKYRHIPDTNPWDILFWYKFITLFSSIRLHLLFRIKLIHSFLIHAMKAELSTSWNLLACRSQQLQHISLLLQVLSKTLFFIQGKFFLKANSWHLFLPSVCFYLFFLVCISSFQLDWTILETTDLSLYFFSTPFHLAWCVHLTDSVNFNGLISWERWRGEGPSANLGDNWAAEVVTILFNVILSGLRTLSCK